VNRNNKRSQMISLIDVNVSLFLSNNENDAKIAIKWFAKHCSIMDERLLELVISNPRMQVKMKHELDKRRDSHLYTDILLTIANILYNESVKEKVIGYFDMISHASALLVATSKYSVDEMTDHDVIFASMVTVINIASGKMTVGYINMLLRNGCIPAVVTILKNLLQKGILSDVLIQVRNEAVWFLRIIYSNQSLNFHDFKDLNIFGLIKKIITLSNEDTLLEYSVWTCRYSIDIRCYGQNLLSDEKTMRRIIVLCNHTKNSVVAGVISILVHLSTFGESNLISHGVLPCLKNLLLSVPQVQGDVILTLCNILHESNCHDTVINSELHKGILAIWENGDSRVHIKRECVIFCANLVSVVLNLRDRDRRLKLFRRLVSDRIVDVLLLEIDNAVPSIRVQVTTCLKSMTEKLIAESYALFNQCHNYEDSAFVLIEERCFTDPCQRVAETLSLTIDMLERYGNNLSVEGDDRVCDEIPFWMNFGNNDDIHTQECIEMDID